MRKTSIDELPQLFQCTARRNESGWSQTGAPLLCGEVPGRDSQIHDQASGTPRTYRMGAGEWIQGRYVYSQEN